MFWEEDTAKIQFQVPNRILDLVFSLRCRELPVDHAYALSQALGQILPWVLEDARIGIHTVHVAGSQNGWERPTQDSGQRLMLSQRTRFSLRIPKERLEALQQGLAGVTLDVAGCPMTLGQSRVRPLSNESTLFARHVVIGARREEDAFLRWVADELGVMQIRIRKALCGKAISIATPDGPLFTRGLLLAELSPAESVRLQEQGLGPGRFLGCGLFIPHKSIGAVKDSG